MPAVAGLLTTDPLITHSFFLELDGEIIASLSGVSGLDIEVEVITTAQVGKMGSMQTIKTLGNQTKATDLSITRLAPLDASSDKLWGWFNAVRDKGIKAADRTSERKNGSIVMYDTFNEEVARFNFYNAWPAKISTDALSVDSNDAVKETITLAVERLERIK